MLDFILFIILVCLVLRVTYIILTASPEDRKAYLIIIAVIGVIAGGIETGIIKTDGVPKVIDIQDQVRGLR